MKKIITMVALALISAVSVTTFDGCKKEKTKGCMDKDSYKYNSSAEEDDGSCRYQGSIVFYQGASPAYSLNVYIDGQFVGNSNVVFSSAPSCGNGAALTVTKDLGSSKSKSFSYTITYSSTGVTYSSGTLTLIANTCIQLKVD